MKRKLLAVIAAASYIAFTGGSPVSAVEPIMSDYCSVPVFLADTAPPNIMIIMDNSGSMNFNAYGTWPGNGGLVGDNSYVGQPNCGILDTQVLSGPDDSEEGSNDNGAYNDQNYLDLGSENGVEAVIDGIRFQDIGIPPGATITNAYIVFTAGSTQTGAISLEIVGEASENATTYTGTQAVEVINEISGRPQTIASVPWNVASLPDPMVDWVAGQAYQTPDLTIVVQEIIDQVGWQLGNSLAFMLKPVAAGVNFREANSYNNNPALAPRLHIEYTPGECEEYYGYFNPEWFYEWNNNKFEHKYRKLGYAGGCWQVEDTAGTPDACLDNAQIVAEGLYDGNFMNWATMRRVDVARKVLMGGLATARTGGGNQTVFGETPAQAARTFIKHYDSTGLAAVTPYDGSFYYGMSGGYVYVDNDNDPFAGQIDRYKIAVQKEEAYEPNDFHEGNVAGVLQKVGDVARWGNIFFNDGTGSNESGGYVASTIGTNITSLITDLQNTGADTWTPLAEAFYVAAQYFKQEDVQGGLDYPNNVIPNANDGQDPYCHNPPCPNPEDYVGCADSFVILFTDGASTMDSKIPPAYKDYDGDGDSQSCNESNDTGCDYASGGTDFLDDLALYARTTDLRADLDGDQNLLLYPIYAFGNDPNARNLLMDAARNGGFDDLNGNSIPDLVGEWDEDANGIPDTYFEATNGGDLETALINAILDILNRASSGTAVSVLATSAEGEGNVVQAYFNPLVTSDASTESASWVGFLQSIWIDQKGFMREDSNQNLKLDIEADKVIQYNVDDSGETIVSLFNVSALEPYPDLENDTPTDVPMEDLQPIWEAGSILADTAADDRKIFTTLDNLGDNVPDAFDDFTIANADNIMPFLGVKDPVAWAYLGGAHGDRADNLVQYIRGHDDGFVGSTRTRNRTIEVEISPGVFEDKTMKLGDIVHSTPVAVAAPPDRYALIYSDESYKDYERLYTVRKSGNDIIAGRETVIYAGASDGMLHAFTSWYLDDSSQFVTPLGDIEEVSEFRKPGSSGVIQTTPASPVGEQIGTELWAYIPQALLPHLKWLADPDYCHVYSVDLKPKIADARIFDKADPEHPNGWGTVLIGGMRYGGKEIDVTDDFAPVDGVDETRTFKSSYFAIDITNPRAPELLWERTYEDLGLTTFFPAIVKVGRLDYREIDGGFRAGGEDDRWYVVLGSGPSSDSSTFDGFNGVSTTPAHIYVVDLKDGAPFKNAAGNDWLFETADDNAYLGSAASFDKELNYNVDAIYLSESHDTAAGDRLGAIYKVTVPWYCTAADCSSVLFGNTKIGLDWVGEYATNPLDPANPWTMSKLFDSPRPITAAPALSIDFHDAVWVYFGTGRYFNLDDKATTDIEYIAGLKDPFFNEEHGADPLLTAFGDDYYHNYSQFLTLADDDPSKFMDAGELIVEELGLVYDLAGVAQGDIDDLKLKQRKGYNGWFRELPTLGERSLNKPIVFGGFSLFTTFVPSTEICSFGGNSYLYALYFETGTPYTKPAFDYGIELNPYAGPAWKIKERLDLGLGLASSPGIHAAGEGGGKATGYSQKSTGQVSSIAIDPALKVRSGLVSWHDLTVQPPEDYVAPVVP